MSSESGGAARGWNGQAVRLWLDSRIAAARLDQAAADRRGYAAQGDFDAAAAEEWSCRALAVAGHADDQATFVARIKAVLAQDEYRMTGIYDDTRFERQVRATLRKIARMAKTNEGFANRLRYQG